MTEQKPFPVAILAHRNCHDGTGAGLAGYLYHKARHENPLFFWLDPNRLVEGLKKVLELDPKTIVRSFDVAFNPQAYTLLADRFDDLLIFDHHKSTSDNFSGNLPPKIVFDNYKSGAVLAWEYYFPGHAIPPLYMYLWARDTWNWKLLGESTEKIQETKQICLGLYEACLPIDSDETEPNFSQWEHYVFDHNWVSECLMRGRYLEHHQSIVIASAKKNAVQVKFGSHTVTICNSSDRTVNSDLGNQLARETPCDYAMVWCVSGTTVYVSLRSIGDFDVSEIARKYPPGGGHKNAAAFSCQFHQFRLGQHDLAILNKTQEVENALSAINMIAKNALKNL